MLEVARSRLSEVQVFPAWGRVLKVGAGVIVADGPDVELGAHCEIPAGAHRTVIRVEAVAADSQTITFVPFDDVRGVRIGDRIVARLEGGRPACGDDFAGRAVDALGRAIDGGPSVRHIVQPFAAVPVLDRQEPDTLLETGIRAVDGLLTLGHGMRMGVLAASGVGKTRLIEQILANTGCSRVVLCLVGERGREVEATWNFVSSLPAERAARISIVAATSDEGAPMRVRAVEQALVLAEYWRDKGEDVLFVVDSITRLAMALREIGLAAGEPATVRAYTPGVFRELPKIVERCGRVRGGGSITAVFTVLSENDDVDDPVVETMKSLLDGHIVLSRKLAQAGHYPAIDIGRSISRLFDKLADPAHRAAARTCRRLLARYEESRMMVESGLYKAGADADLDEAIRARPLLGAFLQQGPEEVASVGESIAALQSIAQRTNGAR